MYILCISNKYIVWGGLLHQGLVFILRRYLILGPCRNIVKVKLQMIPQLLNLSKVWFHWNSEVSCGHSPRCVAVPRSCPSSAPGSPVAACFDAMNMRRSMANPWLWWSSKGDNPNLRRPTWDVRQPQISCGAANLNQSQIALHFWCRWNVPKDVTWDILGPRLLMSGFHLSTTPHDLAYKDGPLLDANGISQYVSMGGTGSWFGWIISHWQGAHHCKDCYLLTLLHRTHSQVDKVCQKFLFHFHGCVESFLGVLTSEPSLKLDKEKHSATKKLTWHGPSTYWTPPAS